LTYRWKIGSISYHQIFEEEYNASPYKNKTYTPIYPDKATAADVGQHYYECQVAKELWAGVYFLITYHITAEAVVNIEHYAYI
jgi:hypothetical protein